MSINNYPEISEISEIKKKRKKHQRFNFAPLGLLVGLIFPAIALIFLYFFFFSRWNFSTYVKMFTDFTNSVEMNNSSKMLSLAMISNLIPFYFFLNKKYYQTTKGILVASFLCGFLIFMYKFIWQ